MAAAKPGPGGKDKSLAPIVVKRIKKAAHGSHGGVWKIAYADFVTAMMAFFLLMWVLGSTTTGDLAGISSHFQNPLRVSMQGGSGSGDATRPVKGGGEDIFRTAGQQARADAANGSRRVTDFKEASENAKAERKRLEQAKDAIEQMISADQELKNLKNQVYIAVGAEGLRIQIVDDKNRPMFAVGSAEPLPYTKRLLRMIGRVLSDMANLVRIEGHTDNRQFGNGSSGYGNWELSSERANAARRELVTGGMSDKRTAQVSGFADSLKLNPDEPSDPVNRRISIMVLRNNQPPAPKPETKPEPVTPEPVPPAAPLEPIPPIVPPEAVAPVPPIDPRPAQPPMPTEPVPPAQGGAADKKIAPDLIKGLPGGARETQRERVQPTPRVSDSRPPEAGLPPRSDQQPINPSRTGSSGNSMTYQLPPRPGLALPPIQAP